MGNEWLIPFSLVAIVPLLATLAFLIRARKSRPYAAVVLVLCILVGLDGMQDDRGWDYRAIGFLMGFCFSAVILGVLASILAGIVRIVSALRGKKT